MTTEQKINAERASALSDLTLYSGSHEEDEAKMCAMEAVSWLANEPFSDHPSCACPVIASAVRRLNDRISNDTVRTELIRPLLVRLVGSKAPRAVMLKRAFIAADWAVRVFAPIALRARGKKDAALELEACAQIVDKTTAEAGRQIARKHAAAAAAAAYAAAAAAYAYAAAAYAAAAAAYAYAYDDDAAAAADDAADAADDAADARRPIYEKAIAMITAMLDCTA